MAKETSEESGSSIVGGTRLWNGVPSGGTLLLIAAILIFLLAALGWYAYAPKGLLRVVLVLAEVALAFAAWNELAPGSLRALIQDWRALSLLALGLHLIAFAAIAIYISPDSGLSIMGRWFDVGRWLHAGRIAYRDFVFEYPPLAVPLFWLPANFAHDIQPYRVGFALEMLAFDLIGVVIALWAQRRFAPHLSPWGIVLLQPVWLLWAGRGLVFEDFDLAPAVLVLLALVLLATGRHRWAWIVLALAVILKLYPIVLVPLFALVGCHRRTRDELADDLLSAAAAVLLPTLVIVRGDLLAVRGFFVYHLQRGIEIESSYASVLLLLHRLTGTPVQHVTGSGSENVTSPITSFLSSLSLPLTALLLLGIYVIAWRGRAVWQTPAGLFASMVPLSLAAVLVFMLAGKVLSPQYLLWLYPLVALLEGRRAITWTLYSAALLFGNWIYPGHWSDMLSFTPHAVGTLLARNGILLAILILVLTPIWTGPASGERSSALPPSAP